MCKLTVLRVCCVTVMVVKAAVATAINACREIKITQRGRNCPLAVDHQFISTLPDAVLIYRIVLSLYFM